MKILKFLNLQISTIFFKLFYDNEIFDVIIKIVINNDSQNDATQIRVFVSFI